MSVRIFSALLLLSLSLTHTHTLTGSPFLQAEEVSHSGEKMHCRRTRLVGWRALGCCTAWSSPSSSRWRWWRTVYFCFISCHCCYYSSACYHSIIQSGMEMFSFLLFFQPTVNEVTNNEWRFEIRSLGKKVSTLGVCAMRTSGDTCAKLVDRGFL